MTTIGLVANVYNEINALPGWLETHLPFFDDVRVVHAGPQSEYSTDGTIELLEKWKVPVKFESIDEGFGVIRTKALRYSPCDWVMILDADERFFPVCYHLKCIGKTTPQAEVDDILQSYDFTDLETKPINWENLSRLGADLRVERRAGIEQGVMLKSVLSTVEEGNDCLMIRRRHWHDIAMTRPTQNWETVPDYQKRIVRNDLSVYFSPNTRMHESLVARSMRSAEEFDAPLYIDHFHFHFKAMEQHQRAHDIAIYNAVHRGEKPPKQGDFAK